MIIVKYETEDEMQQIIDEQTAKGLLLVEVQNVTEGNFLGFSNSPNPQKTPIEVQLDAVKAEVAQVNGNLGGFIDQYYIDNPDKA